MRQFIDEHDLRAARDDRIEIHLLERLPAIVDLPSRYDLEAANERLRFLAAVRLDDPDDDVVAILAACAGRAQHLVRLADARRRTDEDPELADAPVLSPGSLEKGFRRGTFAIDVIRI